MVNTPQRLRSAADDAKYYRGSVFRVVAAQLIAVIIIAGLLATLFGRRAGYSALVGAIISVFPSFYLATRLFRVDVKASAEHKLRSIYVGEAIKVLLTAALFVIAIAILDVNMAIIGLVYVVSVLVYWVALLFPGNGGGI